MKLNESQLMLQAAAQRYFAGKATTHAADSMRERWTQFAEFGWLGGILPEEKGGYGGVVELALLSRQMGAAMAPEPWIEAAVFPITFLSALQGSLARADLCQELIAGATTIVGVPPSVGVLAKHRAYIQRSGNHLKLNGVMSELVPLELADQVLLRADADEGPLVVLVDPRSANIEHITADTIDGRTLTRMTFKDVELPLAAIVAPECAVSNVIGLATDTAVFSQIAQVTGILDEVFLITQEYLQVRSQFGQLLGTFQALRHRLADMFAELEQARAMLAVGVAALQSNDERTRNGLISACKLRVCKAAKYIGAQAIQLHGAIALTQEYRLGAMYKRLLVLERTAGDPLFHAMNFYRKCGHAQQPITAPIDGVNHNLHT
jgi:alkylation response protein AidB-like acyl-CoA dehydrogenase